jgi:hypothetical protein
MLVSIIKERLLETLNRAAATSAQHTSHPMAPMCKIVADDSSIMVSTTNLKASTIATSRCLTKTPGETVVAIARLIAVVSGFDEATEIVLQVTKDTLQVRSGNRRYSIRTHDVSAFPNIAIVADSDSPIELPRFSLKTAFDRVCKFTTEDICIMDGVYMCTSGTTLEAMAFSSQRMARATMPIPQTAPKSWFIPREFFRSAEKMFGESEHVKIDCENSYVSLESEGFLAGTQIPSGTNSLGESLSYMRGKLSLLEDNTKVESQGISMQYAPFAKALSAVSIGFGKASFAEVELEAKEITFGKSLIISGSESDGDCSDITDIVPLSSSAHKFSTRVNLLYLIEMLKSYGTGTAVLNANVALMPIHVESISQPLLGASILTMPDSIGTASYIISPIGETKK